MDKFLDILSTLNLPTVVMIGAIFWYFTKDIKAEMKLLEGKIDRQSERIDRQSERSDRLYEMFIDLLKDRKNG